jgi:hypothetical protein
LEAADASNVSKHWDVIESSAKTARLLAVVGDDRAALEACRKTGRLTEATPDFPRDVFYRGYRAAAYAELGAAYAALAGRKPTPAGPLSVGATRARGIKKVWTSIKTCGVAVSLPTATRARWTT